MLDVAGSSESGSGAARFFPFESRLGSLIASERELLVLRRGLCNQVNQRRQPQHSTNRFAGRGSSACLFFPLSRRRWLEDAEGVVWDVLGAVGVVAGWLLAAVRALVRGGDGASGKVSAGSGSVTVSWFRVRFSFVILSLAHPSGHRARRRRTWAQHRLPLSNSLQVLYSSPHVTCNTP